MEDLKGIPILSLIGIIEVIGWKLILGWHLHMTILRFYFFKLFKSTFRGSHPKSLPFFLEILKYGLMPHNKFTFFFIFYVLLLFRYRASLILKVVNYLYIYFIVKILLEFDILKSFIHILNKRISLRAHFIHLWSAIHVRALLEGIA